jgi:hypothetical protein
MWWYDHQPDDGRRFCRYCHRWHPCPRVICADGGFRTMFRQARERRRQARGAARVFYPEARNV